jgi:hypothetical protein
MSVLPNDYDADPGRTAGTAAARAVHALPARRPVPRHRGLGLRRSGDDVAVDPWDGPLVTLSSAADAAASLDLPLTLTARGCVVYATKAAR